MGDASLITLHIWSGRANITPHLESPQVGDAVPAASVVERLQWLLDGRSPWKWGERVRLSTGAVQRMLKGSFPDPEKLIPALQIENLSLSWLLDGLGSPHLVESMFNDEEGAALIRSNMEGDRTCEILVVCSPIGFTPVLHKPTLRHTAKGEPYRYRTVSIVAGALARQTQVAVGSYAGFDMEVYPRSRVSSVQVHEAAHRLLVRGFMGNTRLFGEDDKSGLYGDAKPEMRQDTLSEYVISEKLHLGQVAEPTRTWITGTQRELHRVFSALNEADQEMALRMVRGLALTVAP